VLGQRRRHAHAHVARAEHDALLAAAARELVARARDLLEVELGGVEGPRALEVLDHVVEGVVADDADVLR